MSSVILSVMLVTGEEIIGSYKPQLNDTNCLVIEKPRVVAIMTARDGRQGLGLVPWTKANLDATVEVFKSQTVCKPFEPVQEVIAAYLQETSGIQLANSLPPNNSGIIK